MAEQTYQVRLVSGGRIVILRRDGEDMNEEDRQRIRKALTSILISEKNDRVLSDRGVSILDNTDSVTPGGVEFEIDAMTRELESIRQRIGVPKRTLAKAAFIPEHRLYDWLRGKSRPFMEDLRAMGAILGVVPMLIPIPVVKYVERIKERYSEHQIVPRTVLYGVVEEPTNEEDL